MKVQVFALGPFSANTLVLVPGQGNEVLVVDPGFDAEQVVQWLNQERYWPAAMLLTHAHLDHAYGIQTVSEAFPGVSVLLHPEDLLLYENLPQQAQLFGFPPPRVIAPEPTLQDRQSLELGGEKLVVRHCPGHSPGHVVFLGEDEGRPFAAVGDVIFARSVGRTDLWGGSFAALEASIRQVIYKLPPETVLFPGHGPTTTVADEKTSNPFVAFP